MAADKKLKDELDRITADLVVQNRIIENLMAERAAVDVHATLLTARQHEEVWPESLW